MLYWYNNNENNLVLVHLLQWLFYAFKLPCVQGMAGILPTGNVGFEHKLARLLNKNVKLQHTIELDQICYLFFFFFNIQLTVYTFSYPP